ncbi:MAG: hypothetical protein LC777_09685, partial [Actinobacteria bacterium]|nr:hypothetical protein [Actinomycetota bacterium]
MHSAAPHLGPARVSNGARKLRLLIEPYADRLAISRGAHNARSLLVSSGRGPGASAGVACARVRALPWRATAAPTIAASIRR